VDGITGIAKMMHIHEQMWFALCNISMIPDKSDILKRWKYYKDSEGNHQRELLGQIKVTVEMIPLPKETLK
jgi:hypothetical protein